MIHKSLLILLLVTVQLIFNRCLKSESPWSASILQPEVSLAQGSSSVLQLRGTQPLSADGYTEYMPLPCITVLISMGTLWGW